ncbi:hypothetical protein EV368DRAFT_69838 [Lentinula lateritia]|nr:hypothetical protein EV368DRAFT_69838 [Lentinula lateritia]
MSNTGVALEYDVEAMNTMALEEVKIQRGSIVVQSFYISIDCYTAPSTDGVVLQRTKESSTKHSGVLGHMHLSRRPTETVNTFVGTTWLVHFLALLLFFPHLQRAGLVVSSFVSSLATLTIWFIIMKFIFVSLVMPILVRILARPGYATPIARPHELQARGLFYAQPQPLQLPTGSRCWFALNHNKKHDKSKRLNFEGNQIKSNGEKFLCGALPNGIIRVTEDRLCVLMSDAYFFTGTKTVYSRAPRNSMPNTVSFYITQMSMDHTLLTNEQINFTGVCYTQIETQKLGHLEIDWQNWNITGWPTNDDGTRIPVGDMEKHHKAEASMAAAFYSDVESD